MKTNILGIEFDSITPEDALSAARGFLSSSNPGGAAYIVTPNPEIAQICSKDGDYRAVINGADLVLADGVGVSMAAKILRRPLAARITGIDFAEKLFALCADAGYRVYLLGGAAGVAEAAKTGLCRKFDRLKIVGTQCGYFDDEVSVVSAINDAKPDVVAVCLGAPKQELFMARNAPALSAKMMIGLGGAIDVWSGNVRRAPVFMQKHGLEWLYRAIREPRRIGKVLRLPLYIISAIKARLSGKGGKVGRTHGGCL